MSIFESLLLVVHLVVAVAVCGLVLLQHGKGADMGAAFGSGSSGSLFGAAGSANFLSRTTAILAAVFFLSSLGLTYLGAMHGPAKDVMQQGVMGDTPATPKGADIPKGATPPASTPAPAGSAPAGGIPTGDAAPAKQADIPK